MGILNRFADIMSANINALLDKAEDPAKMVDQTLRNLREDLAQVKKETAAVMADEMRDKRELEECQANIAKMETAAQNALKSGNEDDCRKLIAKKQKYEAELAGLQENYTLSKSNATKMRDMHDKLVSDIETLESKKNKIKATVANAKAQKHINEIKAGEGAARSIEAFNRMEGKANRMLDEAFAVAQLNNKVDETTELAEKYTTGCTATVDEELEKMKKNLGL